MCSSNIEHEWQKKVTKLKKNCLYQHNTYELHIIAFGNGMKGKDGVRIKVQQVSITGVLFGELKQRQKEGMFLMVYIDEFNTSKVRFA